MQPGFGSGKGSTNWIDTPAGLYSTGDQNITVGKNTNLTAAGLISTDGQVNLDTGTLTWSDFVGSQKYQGYQVNADIDLYGGKDANGITQNNSSAEGKYQLDDVEQSVKATISGSGDMGNITIRNPGQQAALEQSGQTGRVDQINTDPTQLNVVTKNKHIDLEPYISVQSLQAAVDAGKSIADAINEAMAKMVADGTISAADQKALPKLQQYANDPEVQKQESQCLQSGASEVCTIKTSVSEYGYGGETIVVSTDALQAFTGATGVATAAVAAGLIAYAYNTNSGEQFIDKIVPIANGLQGEIVGNKDDGSLTFYILYPDQTKARIGLGVTATNGQLAVEYAYGPDGQPLSTATLDDFVNQINGAGSTVQIVYNQKSGSGSGSNGSSTSSSSSSTGSPDPEDDNTQ
ncbi:hypothetical protein QD357_30905 [Rhizobium sp. BR 317]|uniref:hypothetical protein n=1 Tax=Rhizobium sp. BR 317 TaxID=3040015 RepID=UPI0039BFBC1B